MRSVWEDMLLCEGLQLKIQKYYGTDTYANTNTKTKRKKAHQTDGSSRRLTF